MNEVNIIGRLLEQPEKALSSNGIKFAKFKLAVDKANKDGEANGYDVFEVVVFRDVADTDMNVGQFIGITGRLSANNYEKDGKAYYNCSIIGNNITLMNL